MQWEAGGLFCNYSMGYQDCELEHGMIPPQECPGIYRPYGAYRDSAYYVVAASSSPSGPFDEIITLQVNTAVTGAGDFEIFVEGDKAYLAYDAWGNNHQVVVEQLTANFVDSLGNSTTSGPISPEGYEAPVLFKRNGWYYLHYGPTCCFCRFGSGAELFTAKSPLGPWTDMKIDLNPKKLHSMNRTVPTQNSYVFQAILKDGSPAFFAAGDMWSSAEDNLISHDLQY